MTTRTALTAALLALPLLLAGCGGGDSDASGTGGAEEPLRVGASPVPHAEILEYVAEVLAPEAGLAIEVVEFTDYVQPNVALHDGSIDANYFQHEPYLTEQENGAGYQFEPVAPVHLEPLGLYSAMAEEVADLPDGATVAIPNDPSNVGRALRLLAEEGLLTLADTGDAAPTTADIEENPKQLQLSEIEAAQLPRVLGDVDAAVINGNYALEAGLSPAEDAVAAESADDNPYANLLVTREGEQDDERVARLAELLQSKQVADFIAERYEGAVVPAA
ncbi:MetQ/NlpA family ABC transporter substrate-binding protein [Ornithinicoccus halotolerans]|uniref:MetQ/NlpA family ABC transporter substrate-binding protein n=1 Tax=Ornithinicoccus halotolerans TaxID=1748220 RepID=UPI001297E8A9|nr:MetQ/NlpA family ABC transporter substrate-binding protein [Ornithinicoccus halotolerans]